MNAYSAHMETTFWKDPENFKPERFLDGDNKIINSARVINFGLGRPMPLLIKCKFRLHIYKFEVKVQIAYPF